MSFIHLASTWLRGFPSFGGTYAGIALTPAATVIMWILLANKCLVSIEIYHTLRPISTPGVYLEVQRPCWPCDSSGSSTISRSPLTISIRISQVWVVGVGPRRSCSRCFPAASWSTGRRSTYPFPACHATGHAGRTRCRCRVFFAGSGLDEFQRLMPESVVVTSPSNLTHMKGPHPDRRI